MNAKTNNFDINLNNPGANVLSGATVANNKQKEYINLNCYVQKVGDETPEWVFQASCVVNTRKATESILKKIAQELLNNMKKEQHEDELTGDITFVDTNIPNPIKFTFIEGNMKKEKEEMDELF